MGFELINLTTLEDIVGQFEDFVSDNLIPTNIVPVLIQLCSTAVIFIFVAKFFFKPVRELLSKRQAYVEGQIKDSEEAKKNALEYEEISKKSIDEAKEQAKLILENAKKQAEEQKEKSLNETEQEIKQMKLQAELDIEREKVAASEEVKKQIIEVAMQATEVVLNREVKDDDNTRLVEEFIKDIVN